MIAYTSIDIIASVMKNNIFMVNFMIKDNYVELNWCVAYVIATNYAPAWFG